MKTPYWTRVIQNAKKRLELGKEPFSKKHRKLAYEWPTCACGKQDPRIKRCTNGMPKDYWLGRLGSRFGRDIHFQDPAGAAIILTEIEEHVELIISDL